MQNNAAAVRFCTKVCKQPLQREPKGLLKLLCAVGCLPNAEHFGTELV